jgi:hypothetical protein
MRDMRNVAAEKTTPLRLDPDPARTAWVCRGMFIVRRDIPRGARRRAQQTAREARRVRRTEMEWLRSRVRRMELRCCVRRDRDNCLAKVMRRVRIHMCVRGSSRAGQFLAG